MPLSYRYHTMIIACCIGVLVGVLAVRFHALPAAFLYSLAALLLVLSAFLRKLLVVGCFVLGVGLGTARSYSYIEGYSQIEILIGQKIEIAGTVVDDPKYHESGQRQFHVRELVYAGEQIDAELRIRGYINEVGRGDRVLLGGKLRDGFAYWQGSLYYADISVVETNSSVSEEFRNNAIAGAYTHIPDPEASLGIGFLLGVRTLLPDQLVTELRVTGLTHIVAVSGYNLTILVNIARRLLHPVSRRFAVIGALSLIAFFVMLTGWSPSILRAVIVSVVALYGWMRARPVRPWLLLLYSSVLSAWISPYYVWFDIGWYLSLFAFFGVLILAPPITARIYKKRDPGLFGQILIETTCAQIMTTPLIMYVFGEVSMIALLANMVVLPLIPLAMLLTAAVVPAAFVGWKLGAIVALPAYVLLAVITNLIRLFAKVDNALIEARLSLMQMLFSFSLALLMSYVLIRRLKSSQSVILEPD